jgi:hypothetical protein
MSHYSMPALPAMGSDVTALKLVYNLVKRALGVLIMTSVQRKRN